MRFPESFLDQVLERNNIVDIISQYTQLKPNSNGFMGRCPFPAHSEKTASFSVSETKQVYYCFGCLRRGNAIGFLKEYNGMSFVEAVEYLADRAGLELPQQNSSPESGQQRDQRRRITAINQMAVEFFQMQLRKQIAEAPARRYIAKRGLTETQIDEFEIGVSGAEWDGLVHYLGSKGVTSSEILEAKLARSRNTGDGIFDLFRERLMFPIRNVRGEAIGFGGRVLGEGEPKYLNSPETPVFSKGRTLYGLYQSGKFIRSEDRVVVVEGYMDFLALYGAGLRTVVATLGTALTPDHARTLRKLTRNIVILFDGDKAGQNAMERSLPILLEAGLLPKALILPGELDPDEFIQERGVEDLKQHLTLAPDLFKLVFMTWLTGYKGEIFEKIKVLEMVQPLLLAIENSQVRSLYVRDVASRMGVTAQWLESSLKENGRKLFPASSQASGKEHAKQERGHAQKEPIGEGSDENVAIPLQDVPPIEVSVLQLVLRSRSNFEVALANGVFDLLTHPGIVTLLRKAEDIYRQDVKKFDTVSSLAATWTDRPELVLGSGGIPLLQDFSVNDLDSEKEARLLHDYFKRIRESLLQGRIDTLMSGLKLIVDEGEKSKMLSELMQLQRQRLKVKEKQKEEGLKG